MEDNITVYVGEPGNYRPLDMTPEEYRQYMAVFGEPQQEPLSQEYGQVLKPFSPEAEAAPPQISDYLDNPYAEPSTYGQIGKYGTQLGVTLASGPAAPLAGLWLYGGSLLSQALHGDDWTPDKYQPMSREQRRDYFLNRTSEARANEFSPLTDEYYGQSRNKTLIDYLSYVPPVEDMVWYNPGTLPDKFKAYANTQYSRGQIEARYKDDMKRRYGQQIAKKFGLTMPNQANSKRVGLTDMIANYQSRM